jgi:hypothetical protein
MTKTTELLGSITAWLSGTHIRRSVRKRKAELVAPRLNVESFPRTMPTLHAGRDRTTDRPRTTSCLCTHAELDSPAFRRWAAALGEPWRAHRKLWELCYICETLEQRGLLAPGKKGLGFAVGQERLPSFFASRGCGILASDLPSEDERNRAWAETGQWASGLEPLNAFGLCAPEQFRKLVRFRPIDMNEIPADLTGFDFTWSTCSFEHCGSLELGLRFLERQMDCLAPGGIAVHTTEFNLSSNDETVDYGSFVVYRLKDIENVCLRLQEQGHTVEPLDLDTGTHALDRHVDLQPYSGDRHLRLNLNGFAATSIGLIIRKGPR